ncbi:hypothetical protein EDD21DRAFT_371512 [Dissophora ornata]|nr:hypothetical protein EDD21DRAFT_371512 [Dissophora ornata]
MSFTDPLKVAEEFNNDPNRPQTAPTDSQGVKPFLGLTREQSQNLLALYKVIDPELAPQVPMLYPEMHRKFTEDRQERSSILAKLERAPEVYQEEVLNIREIQKAVAEALLQSDMDAKKAREYLNMKPLDVPMEELTIQEVLTNGFLFGGVRDAGSESSEVPVKKQSALSAPGFRDAKKFYEHAFEEHQFSMAAVQLGIFYTQEAKDCKGENCIEGEDPEKMALEYFLKAAEMGNPMAMHKAGWHYDQRDDWKSAIPWYEKAAEQGYPDSAHNLGVIYQEGNQSKNRGLEDDLPLAIEFFNRGLQFGYGPSGVQLGRIFFKLALDKSFREKIPEDDENYSSDPQEYLQAAISYFNKANQMLEAESLELLGMIYGSDQYGLYNIESAQNLLELALIVSNGSQHSYDVLTKILQIRVKIIANELMKAEATKGSSSKGKTDGATELRTCAGAGCENQETTSNQFQRCGGCKKVYYCSRLCQVNDWKSRHKKNCNK